MQRVVFHNRKAVQIETALIRVTVTEEGGHIAEILNKATGVSPLWIPPWTSIEPSAYSPANSAEYGGGAEGHLLSAIMGHNLCLDLFGPPSDAEFAAGLGTHGEASVAHWDFESCPDGLIARCALPLTRLAFERVITLHGSKMSIRETVENLDVHDRPFAWTQHVTLGAPFLDRGRTQFLANGGLCGALPDEKTHKGGYVLDKVGAPLQETLSSAASSGAFRSFLMDKSQDDAFFIAWSPALDTALAYCWKRVDFPWIGVWDENNYRETKPWSARTLARGLEFSATPFPETRKEMIQRGSLMDTPGFVWLPAKGKLTVQYHAATIKTKSMPASVAEFEA